MIEFILHQCNDAIRIRKGLSKKSARGLEVDFFEERGRVWIGHDPNARRALRTLIWRLKWHSWWTRKPKILIADIKDRNMILPWSLDHVNNILLKLHKSVPKNVPIFITGYSLHWIPLVIQTINIWGERPVTYFVDGPSLKKCQTNYKRQGVQFGINHGITVGALKIAANVLSLFKKTKTIANAVEGYLDSRSGIDQDAWDQADVRMVWTLNSPRQASIVSGLKPDYVICEEI